MGEGNDIGGQEGEIQNLSFLQTSFVELWTTLWLD